MDEALLTENDDRSGNESNMKEGEEDMGKPMEVNVMGNDACERVEEIISPASTEIKTKTSISDEERTRNDNATQFFRRVHLICQVNAIIAEKKHEQDIEKTLGTNFSDEYITKAVDDPFPRTKTNVLRDDLSTDLGKPENIKRLTRLSLYEPIIYCDDSVSMSGDNHWEKQGELVMRIARVVTKIVPEDFGGVRLCFINSPSSSPTVEADGIERAYNSVSPESGTKNGTKLRRKTRKPHANNSVSPDSGSKIGTNLRLKILEPHVYKVISTATSNDPFPFKRPLLVCVTTDGCPSGEPMDTLKNVIIECRQKLIDAGYEPTAVTFCISQIGTDRSATSFLEGLREELRIQDVLYCTADLLDEKFNELKENERGLESWLLETLVRPIMGWDD